MKTETEALEIVRQDGMALQDVPEELRTADVCMEAVKQCGAALEYVPEALKMPEVCLEAVRQDGRALEFVPDRWKTPELCLEAVKEYAYALAYVPKSRQTAEMFLAAMQKNRLSLGVLAVLPKELHSEKFWLEAVRLNGMALKYAPEGMKTPAVCMAAVRKNGMALEWAPEALKMAELCMEAVRQDGGALQFVPEELKTADVCRAAILHPTTSDKALPFLPKRFRMPESPRCSFVLKSAQSAKIRQTVNGRTASWKKTAAQGMPKTFQTQSRFRRKLGRRFGTDGFSEALPAHAPPAAGKGGRFLAYAEDVLFRAGRKRMDYVAKAAMKGEKAVKEERRHGPKRYAAKKIEEELLAEAMNLFAEGVDMPLLQPERRLSPLEENAWTMLSKAASSVLEERAESGAEAPPKFQGP